jgi:hypothetical protein
MSDDEQARTLAPEPEPEPPLPGEPGSAHQPTITAACDARAECAICLGSVTDPTPFPHEKCPHVYCAGCLDTLQRHTPVVAVLCPQCRRRGLPPPAPPPAPPPPPPTARRRIAILVFGLFVLCGSWYAPDCVLAPIPILVSPLYQHLHAPVSAITNVAAAVPACSGSSQWAP